MKAEQITEFRAHAAASQRVCVGEIKAFQRV